MKPVVFSGYGGALCRLPHAKRRADEVKSAIDDYLAGNPYCVSIDQDSRTITASGTDICSASGVGLTLGDVFHNLRSALDNLAVALVLANSGNTANVGFPTGSDKEAFHESVWKSNFKRAGFLACAEISKMEFYPGGKGALIHALNTHNIIDKHYIPIPVAHTVVLKSLQVLSPSGHVLLSDRMHERNITDNSSELYSFGGNCKVEFDDALVTEVCLSEPEIFAFKPIGALLESLQASVEVIVHFFDSDERFKPS